MLLDNKVNQIFGKLVALVNGVTQEGDIHALEKDIREVLNALKLQKDLDEMLKKMTILKENYLADCMVCQMPCGRTTDYNINALAENIREQKIQKYISFIQTYTNDLSYDKILYKIAEFSW